MQTPARNSLTDSDNDLSRFGESRFGPSRFGRQRPGAWVEQPPADNQGRSSGLYRPGGDTGLPLTALTIIRPRPTGSTAGAGRATDKTSVPRALSLPAGRNGVLLFHGLSSTPLELQYLARGLHRAGFTVRVAVLEGYSHGMPNEKLRDHRAWAAAALSEFDRMRGQCDRLAVGGLCIGALLALHVAARRSEQVSHVLALSTTLHYDGWANPWFRRLLPIARVMPVFGQWPVKEREPYGLKDERLRAWIAAQMQESGGSDAGAAQFRVHDLLEAQNLMRLVKQGLGEIKAPTLLLHARDDETASPRSAFDVVSGVSSERVHCVLLNDSYHMISIDKEKARVLAEMKDFLTPSGQPVPAPSAPIQPSPETIDSRSNEHVRA